MKPPARVQRHTAEQIIDPVVDVVVLEMLEQLGVTALWEPIPVPQMVERLADEEGETIETTVLVTR